MKRVLMVAAAATALTSCQPGGGQAQYNTAIDVPELMIHVIDPAAFMFWRGSGFEITEQGERDLSPTTPEAWKTVEDGAAIVAEAGNMLMLPNRARAPEAEWNKLAKLMTERALEAKEAAMKQDKQAVFDTGGRLYEVCVACHTKFIPAESEPPAKLPDAK
jgi:hypothetical protein